MKKMNLKSLMFALVALFAASAALVFTSCGDDKDEPDSQSIIGQWEVTNVGETYGSSYSRVAWEFKTDGTYRVAEYAEGTWWMLVEGEFVATPIDPNTGKGTVKCITDDNTTNYSYWFEGNIMYYQGEEYLFKVKRTSGLKFEYPPRWF